MDIDNNLVDHLAYLARLKLTDKEKDSLKNHLQKIISYVDELKETDVTNIGQLVQTNDGKNNLRDDAVKPCLPVDKALQNAPDKLNNFFTMPRIIDNP
ncbi:MAG: Asp-tRNA(Asn)/Glu-tRNA(Gln) amidotransferase subunit GatC [Planctomycetota bacterium]